MSGVAAMRSRQCLALAVAAACAAAPLPLLAGELSGSFALSSQLVDRGQAVTAATPVLQGAAAWSSTNGWAFGVSGSAKLHTPERYVEAIVQASHYWSLSGDWSMQAGALYYRYPRAYRFFERTEAGVHWTYRDVLTLGLSAASLPHSYRHRPREAFDASLHWPLTERLSLSAGAGVARSFFEPYRPYRYGHAGLAWQRGAWRVEIDRVAADLKTRWAHTYPAVSPWVGTVQWSF
jgi:uncharacterized protein (TIGR02001 family)